MLAHSELARTNSGRSSSHQAESRVAIKAYVEITRKLTRVPSIYFFGIGLVFLLLFVVSYYSIDPDFGWHLQSGLFYLAHDIPSTDIFTFTASNFPWINHEWLNDYIIAVLFGYGGYALIAVFFSIIWTSAFILASRKHLTSVLIFAAISIIPFAGIRPVAWTVLFVALLERIINSRNIRYSYWLPFVFLLWANLHGSFVLGLLLLVFWQLFAKNKIPWLVIALSFLAALVNPYGPRVYEEIIRTASDSQLRFRISEWKMFVLPILSITYIVVLSAFHFVFNKKPYKSLVSIPGLLFIMTLSSIRHFPVFTTVSLRFLEDYFEEFTKQVKSLNIDKSKAVLLIAIIGTPIIIMIFLSIARIRAVIANSSPYPEQAVAYLNLNKCNGNVFNSYNFGGYLIWQLPEQKVYIDGRMPSWKWQGTDYFKNYELVFKSDEFRREEFSKHNIQCVLVNKTDENFKYGRAVPFGEQLNNEGWDTVGEASSQNYTLYIRNAK